MDNIDQLKVKVDLMYIIIKGLLKDVNMLKTEICQCNSHRLKTAIVEEPDAPKSNS